MAYSIYLHKLFVVLALSIGANLDNLGVGIAYGLRRNHISNFSNFVIALLSAGLTWITMIFGYWIKQILPVSIANELGAVIIILVGMWIFWESTAARIWSMIRSWLIRFLPSFTKLFAAEEDPSVETEVVQRIPKSNDRVPTLPRVHSRYISFKETVVLGVSLALNAMAGGFGASLAGHNAVITSLGIGIFSYLTIDVGQKVSKSYLSKSLGSISQKAAGLLLMFIGAYELIF